MTRFNPTRWPIRWQIAALLIVTQFLAHAATVTVIDVSTARSGGGRINLAISAAEPMLTALRMTEGGDLAGTADRLAALAAADDRFRIETGPASLQTAPPAGLDAAIEAAFRDRLSGYWRDRVRLRRAEDAGIPSMFPLTNFSITAELPAGGRLIFEPRGDTFLENVPRTVALLGLSILGLALAFLSVWAGAALVAPITDLARGAERFAGNTDAAELPEHGPVEVRRATNAFNRMRQRIRKLISDRSQTVAAIGHDMRTPLTRLRLRLELLEEGPVTAAIEKDVQVLERMIDDALSFLRSEGKPLSLDLVDVAVLAKTVADEYADQGHRVDYRGPQRLVVTCDHDLIRRVLDNVVGNAAKFATEAQVVLSGQKPDAVQIEVRDNGPGIPIDHREKVLEPFTRIEAVRSGSVQKSEGFGLGLAIARDLIERHGGTLGLSDNDPAGLVVTLTLPRTAHLPDLGRTPHD